MSFYVLLAYLVTSGYIIPVLIVLLLIVVGLFWLVKAWAERRYYARLAAIAGAMQREAGSIALTLLNHPPAPAAVLDVVKTTLAVDAASYIKSAMPAFVTSTGFTPDKLATAISGEAARQITASGRPLPIIAADAATAAAASVVNDAASSIEAAIAKIAGAAPAAAALSMLTGVAGDVLSGAASSAGPSGLITPAAAAGA